MLDFFRVVPKKRVIKIKSKEGIIFNNPNSNRKKIFYIGNLVVLIALGYFCYLYFPLTKSIVLYEVNKNSKDKNIDVNSEINQKTSIKEFSVKIPKINAISNIQANVSPFDKKEYLSVLDQNLVAQAKGSVLPGEKGTIYLFAHSTRQGIQNVRNNSIFYLLGELKNGDPVFISYNGKIYGYRVYNQKIVGAGEVSYLNYKEDGKEILILQTCWPLGTDWKRLLVFTERI